MTKRERKEAIALEADRWDGNPDFWIVCEFTMWTRFRRAQIAAKASDFYLRVLYAYGSVRPSASFTSSRDAGHGPVRER